MSVFSTTPVAHAPATNSVTLPSAVAPRVKSSGFWLLIALLALVGAGKAIQADTMDPDAFWHLRVADELTSDGVGPLVDRISFASLKTPWTPYSWLAELLMRAIWNSGGFRLATLVTAGCSAAIIVFIAAAARTSLSRGDSAESENNDVAAALLTAVAAFFTLPFISFRPVTFALVVMAIVMWLLVKNRQRQTAWVWAIVPLTVLLTNLHLYAVVIVAVVWMTAAGCWFEDRARFRSWLKLALGVTLAACCTPMLRGVVVTAMNYNAVDPMVAANYITEMRPFYSGGTGRVSLGLFVLMIGVCVWRRSRLEWTDWLWLTLGTLLLFRLGRFSPVFAMLATPAVARAIPQLGGRALGRPIVRVALLAVLIAGIGNLLPALGERDFDRWLNRNAAAYPTAAAAFVESNVSPRHGRLVNEFNWGGYLAWRLGDRYQVLLDGRTQLYSPDFWRQTHLGTAATRRTLLETFDADAAIVPAHDSAFLPSLIDLGWHEVHRDELAVVMTPPDIK